MKETRWAEYLHIIPPVLVLGVAGTFARTLPTSAVYEPSFLMPLLNTALCAALPFLIAVLATVGYSRQGSLMFGLFGCGMVAFGFGSLLAGWGLIKYGPNFSVTLFNTGSLFGGLCQLGGVSILLLRPAAKSSSSLGARWRPPAAQLL